MTEDLDMATGTVSLTLSRKPHAELFGDQPGSSDFYLCIEEASLIVSLNESFQPELLETKLSEWLHRQEGETRGLVVKVRDVVAKLKRLNYVPLPQKGTSHLHFVRSDGTAKVTVPIHCGEIAKGTFKSILNQAGIDLRTFQSA